MTAPTEPVTAPGDEPPPVSRRRGRRLRWAAVAVVALALVGATAVVAVWGLPTSRQDEERPETDVAAAEVQRTTLVREEEMRGRLAYGEQRTVQNRADGVVTWLPEVGTLVSFGERLHQVDGQPSVLLRGAIPAYRTLEVGTRGEDVRQFEQALGELGYGGFTIDNEYTELTASAVRRWQEHAGHSVTGTVEPEHVWFAPEPVRVAKTEADVGDTVDGGLLAVASTQQVVTVDLELNHRELVSEGDEVRVELPDGESVDGTVESIGTVVEDDQEEDGAGEGGGSDDPTVEMVITVDEEVSDDFDQAPVTVYVQGDSREDILAVPVAALIALPGGDYAVTVRDGDAGGRDVPVETGWFVDGLVEIEGDGLDEGTQVVVPQ